MTPLQRNMKFCGTHCIILAPPRRITEGISSVSIKQHRIEGNMTYQMHHTGYAVAVGSSAGQATVSTFREAKKAATTR